jgi:hypothetical protein
MKSSCLGLGLALLVVLMFWALLCLLVPVVVH